jgi:hypothetical protein
MQPRDGAPDPHVGEVYRGKRLQTGARFSALGRRSAPPSAGKTSSIEYRITSRNRIELGKPPSIARSPEPSRPGEVVGWPLAAIIFGIPQREGDRPMRTTLAIVVAAAVGLFSAVPARAQDAASVNHLLKLTVFDGGPVKLGGLPKAGLFIIAKPVSFICTRACTLEVSIMEQLHGNRTAKNLWSICADIDGKTDGFPCLFQGTLPTDSSPVIGNYLWSVPLAAGTHTSNPLVFVSAPAVISNFQIAYRIYQP